MFSQTDLCSTSPPAIVSTTSPGGCASGSLLSGSTFTAIAGLPVGCNSTNHDVWYQFVAKTTDPTITYSAGTLVNGNIQLFSGACGSLTSINCSTTSIAASGLTIGSAYLIRIYSSTAANTGTFTVCVIDKPKPANDDCANAASITSASTCIPATSSLIGQTLNEATVEGSGIATSCGGTTLSQDVWYKFVAQSVYPTVTVSNLGASWSTKLRIQLLSGSCGSFTEAGCANNAPLMPSTPLTVGNTYYIRILKNDATAPVSGIAAWAFDICVTDPSPVTYSSISRMNEVFQQTILSAPNVLNTAWEVTYGPDGYLWVTEAKGYKAYRINPNTGARTTILDISKGSVTSELTAGEHTTFNVKFNAGDLSGTAVPWTPATTVPWPQGGFAGLAIHPDFQNKPYVYISYVNKFDSFSTTTNGGYYFKNSIVRFTYNSVSGKLESPVAICDTLPGSSDHNSQRMIIAPVGGTYYLFYGQGEMGAGQLVNQWRPNHAQDTTYYQGKILRFKLEASGSGSAFDQWIPDDNPYNKTTKSAVWCIGLRNNQGFAYDTTYGVLYGSMHGPYSDDEINILQRYKNYGHPLIEGYAADGNYNGTTTPGLSTSRTAGAPFTVSSGLSTLSPIGNEQHTADSINASPYAHYKDPLFSAYPGPTSGATSIATIWATNPGNGNWPSEAWSGMDFYSNTIIPGWKNSLVVCGLKWGRVLRFKLGAGDTTIVPTNGVDTVAYFQGHNRYRDLAFNPNGKDIYISMESSTSSGPANGTATVPTCTNCIVKYTFLGYADLGGKSTIPDAIDVTDTLTNFPANAVDSATTVTIDNSNNNLWVPITGPDGNILAEIKANGNNLGVVRSAFYKNVGPIRIKNGVHYLNRNMTITPQTQPGSPVTIRLYLTSAEFDSLNNDPLGGVNLISDLKILKNSDACSAAIGSSTTLIAPTFEELHGTKGYMLQGSISSFSSFYFASSNILLPLHLLTFKGSLQNNVTQLEWETTNEVNTSQFVIERSLDGRSFQQIGATPAKNNNSKNKYSFIDYEAMRQSSSILYYRLKMVDIDGGFTYSDVVIITLPSATGKVSVFPNPAKNEIRVSMSVPSDGKVQWTLIDNAGRVVIQNSMQIRKGNNDILINIANVSTGFYYLSVSGAGIDQKVKLEKL